MGEDVEVYYYSGPISSLHEEDGEYDTEELNSVNDELQSPADSSVFQSPAEVSLFRYTPTRSTTINRNFI
jgi:hypothetical protein